MIVTTANEQPTSLEMRSYGLSSFILRTTIPFPELEHAHVEAEQVVFRLQANERRSLDDYSWFHRWLLPDGSVWLLIGRHEGGYALGFPGLADFAISTDGKHIDCWPEHGIPLETIRHLFLDQVFPLALSTRSNLILHASAVANSKGAIAFVGKSGLGKSTLALYFASRGWQILTDDFLPLEIRNGRLLALPSYPGIRLWGPTVDALLERTVSVSAVAHYSEKKRVCSNSGLAFWSAPAAIQRIYFIGNMDDAPDPSPVSLRPISAIESFAELIKYGFVLDIRSFAALKQHFASLVSVAERPVFHRLDFKRGLPLLPDVYRSVLETLKGSTKSRTRPTSRSQRA